MKSDMDSRKNAVCAMLLFYFGVYCVNKVSSALTVDPENFKEALTSHYSNSTEDAVYRTEFPVKGSFIDVPKVRVKRQAGGKYEDAAKMDQLKIFRLLLTMFRNMWSTATIGGTHPLHHEVPKTFIQLYREKFGALASDKKASDGDD